MLIKPVEQPEKLAQKRLGEKLLMLACHSKIKNGRIDSYKIDKLMRGGNFPLAYVYPREMRTTRDLLRRRTCIVRHGADLKAHIVNTTSQYNHIISKYAYT